LTVAYYMGFMRRCDSGNDSGNVLTLT